jgi:hypothetical protein
MYSQYGNGVPELSNNPFVNDPRNADTRFPDISGSDPTSLQYALWLQSQGQQGQYQQQMQQQQLSPQSTVPSYPQNIYGTNMAFSPQATGQPFQPSTSFGQQLVGQVNATTPTGRYGQYGSSYGYLDPQQQQQQTQQQQQQMQLLSEFDPYSSLGQGWSGQSQQQQPPPQQQYNLSSPTTSQGPAGQPHPRDYIRTHKAELESWDTYAWKQMLSAFDALKDSWERRRKELEGRIGQVQMQMQMQYGYENLQQEGMRLQGVSADLDGESLVLINFALACEGRRFKFRQVSHHSFIFAFLTFATDSTAASLFQMREVFQGYRQSGDLASKKRVRESCNAALNGLPDWPGT